MEQLSKQESAIFLAGRRADGCRCGLLRIWFFTSAAVQVTSWGFRLGIIVQCNAGDAVL